MSGIPTPDAEWRTRLVVAARACLGTRFHHQGRVPDVGLDCLGLLVVAAQAAGMLVADASDYGPLPDGQRLARALSDHGLMPLVGPVEAGDVLLFRFRGQPQHVAIATAGGAVPMMIHAYAPVGAVIENALSRVWSMRLVARLGRGQI